MVGLGVGLAVVGSFVGRAVVGSFVGNGVGDFDGEDVGSGSQSICPQLDISSCFTVGLGVGEDVGNDVGCFDGDEDGDVVGCLYFACRMKKCEKSAHEIQT